MLADLIRALLPSRRDARAREELRRFHRAELREFGVTDQQLERFLAGQ